MKSSTFATLLGIATAISASSVSFGEEHQWRPEFSKRQSNETSWPYGPLSTRGRDIVNTKGDVVTWAGVNWPGSGETMVPEGLEWSSVDEILDMIQSVGFNFIRLTYAVEMVDQIYASDGDDVPLDIAMINGLGYTNGTKVTREMVAKNPAGPKIRLDSKFGTPSQKPLLKGTSMFIQTSTLARPNDGNAWFDDYNFPVDNWHRALRYVADWAKGHENVVSMSLRNELRRPINVSAPTETYGYNWVSLVGNLTAATDAIYDVNPDILITWSGMQYDQDLSALTTGLNLNTAPCYKCDAIRDAYRRDPINFDLGAHPWADKVVYVLHLYAMSENLDTGSCPIVKAEFYQKGFNALGIDKPAACNRTGGCTEAVRQTPVILSEFGSAQDQTLFNDTLQTCLREFTTEHNVSWAMWSLAGSYRIRSGAQGVPDTWALTNYEWDGWAFKQGIEKWWKPWVAKMLGNS
ncbi:hypothetical protein D0868_00635 [Hortaea werneckii]|uniref:Uncharacterized protein n=1 Tax=Hortaea werneckii TaxID=91943 RepID=A0A3M6ZL72_HORWE|nr:hypothetical protein D0868_00635 [Hortaea werneckii]